MSSKASSHSAGSCVAFDLGANAVRVVEIEWTGADGVGRLAKRGTAALPVNVWNDLPSNAAAFTAALRQAMSSAGITAKSVSASLPRRLVTLRFARLPHAPPELMRGLVANEAQQYVLFPLDEVILDYHVAEGNGGIGIPAEDDLESVLLAAARRSLVTDLIGIFEKAGLELEQLTVSALALAEHIRDAIEATALIDVEPGEMDVAVVANRQLLFTRASGLDVTGAHPDVAARRLADEVARSFTSFQNEYRQQALTHINLSGPSVLGAEGMAVEQTLGSVLEMHIGRLSSRLMPPTDPDAVAYATAIGAALQTRSGNPASINLVPDERAIKKAQAAQRQQKQLAALAGIAAVVIAGVLIQRVAVASAKEAAARRDVNDKLQKLTAVVDTKRKTYQTRKALYEELTTGLDRSHPSRDVLVALDRAMPQTTQIWLTQLAFERTGLITLHGEAKSARDATDMVIALQSSGAFTDVKVAYLGDAQENNIAASTPPAATPPTTVVVNAPPVTPLPNMPTGNPGGGPGGGGYGGRFSGPGGGYGGGAGGGQNGMNPNGGASGGYPGGYPGAPRNFPGNQTFQPGQFQPGQGTPSGAQPTFIIPGGQGAPTQAPAGAQRIITIDPNNSNQNIEIRSNPINLNPPPFYLIGYGQDQNVTQDANGAQNPDGTQDPNDPNARRQRRRRNQQGQGGQNGQGNYQGNNQGAFPNNFRNGGMGNSGVTPNGAGSSNMMQNSTMPGAQNPMGTRPGPGGGPIINPSVVRPAPATVTAKPVVVQRKPAVTAHPKTTLTSFIITCRLNPQAGTLLSSQGIAPKRAVTREQPTATPAARRPIGEDSDTSDNGGETDGSP